MIAISVATITIPQPKLAIFGKKDFDGYRISSSHPTTGESPCASLCQSGAFNLRNFELAHMHVKILIVVEPNGKVRKPSEREQEWGRLNFDEQDKKE